jgi:IPT/TIG domain
MPAVASVTPSFGPDIGGTAVEIAGDGLEDVTDVGFGFTSAIDVAVISDTLVLATSPAGSGLVDVSVIWADGTEIVIAAAFLYKSSVIFGDVKIVSSNQISEPTITVHPISADGIMPDLQVIAPLLEWTNDAAAVRRFRLEITYDDGYRHDRSRIPAGWFWDVVVGREWVPDFGAARLGGDLNVFIEADVNSNETITWSSDFGSLAILGLNPSKDQVRERIDDAVNIAVVFHRESRFTQFKTTLGVGNAFVQGPHPPLRGVDPGGTVGYGIGQLTTDPVPSTQELWDWYANVDSAYAKLLQLRDDAIVYQHQVQQGLPWTSQTGGKPPNEGTAYPDAPDFTDNQLDLEMYARYNGGYRYHNYNPPTQAWQRRLAPGQDVGTSLPYAHEVEAVKEQVLAGNYPAGW